jgi:hypothetical protein
VPKTFLPTAKKTHFIRENFQPNLFTEKIIKDIEQNFPTCTHNKKKPDTNIAYKYLRKSVRVLIKRQKKTNFKGA